MGGTLSAVDIYSATFMAYFKPLAAEHSPMPDSIRSAFKSKVIFAEFCVENTVYGTTSSISRPIPYPAAIVGVEVQSMPWNSPLFTIYPTTDSKKTFKKNTKIQ